MASIGHFAVAILAAPLAAPPETSRREVGVLAVWLSGASMLPDADVVAFAFGIPYAHAFGHRGASHSFAFAIVCAVIAALLVRRGGLLSPLRAAVVTGVVVASHPLLDMLTDGGLGVALLFPITDRYFFPWRPIPVSPIGPGILSRYGAYVLGFELLWFLPLLASGAWLIHRRRVTASAPQAALDLRAGDG